MTTRWTERYASRTSAMQSSAIRELLKLTELPDVISLAGGLPAAETFPLERVEEACRKILREQGARALQYSTTEGYPPLREFILGKMARYGINAGVENVVITTGSQQALDLVGKILINPGDPVVVEAPTYLGALQAWRPYEPRFVQVPIDDDGMRVDQLEPILKQERVKLIYVLPNFQNPAGTTLSYSRRQRLVELADEHGIPVLEDDPYGELRYSGSHITPVIVLDCRHMAQLGKAGSDGYVTGNVIYAGTLSKTLSPGLRLGWVLAPRELIGKIVQGKQGTDLHTSTFDQMIAYEVSRDSYLDEHAHRIRDTYRVRRDAMLAALDEFAPEGVTWTRPEGGLFLWVRMPEHVSSVELLKDALAEKVAFVPGPSFFADGSGANAMRLNFSNAEPEKIREGIHRLCRVIERRLETVTA